MGLVPLREIRDGLVFLLGFLGVDELQFHIGK